MLMINQFLVATIWTSLPKWFKLTTFATYGIINLFTVFIWYLMGEGNIDPFLKVTGPFGVGV